MEMNMKKNFYKLIFIFTVIISAFQFVACNDIMGYSVLLWNEPEYKLQDGDIVPVYIRSNISSVYVVGVTDEEGEKKIELPLWQLTEPVSKRKVEQSKAKYTEYAHNYAFVKLDGLPCRAEPVNTAKQVYRLRKGEIIKILYKGQGQAVMSGRKALEGDWFRILTSDGTQGWCFSYNLSLFQTDAEGKQIGGDLIQEEIEVDEKQTKIENTIWYPDYFRTLIKSGNIDLTRIHPSYNFDIDVENNKVVFNSNSIHKNWQYEGLKKTGDNEYEITNVPITIVYKRADYIVIRYTDESGKPTDYNYVAIEENLQEIVDAEKERRNTAFTKVYEHGPIFASSNYGTLELKSDGSFIWKNFKLLVPSVIPAGTKNVGFFTERYALSKNLKENYDGILTFKFDGLSKEINFLYKLEDGALRMEDATGSEIDGNLVKTRSSSPLILYFKVKVD